LSNRDNDTKLQTIATATNLTHSFNPRSGTDTFFQHPYWETHIRYNHSLPPYSHNPFSMASTHHTHLRLNNTFVALIGDIEINPKDPAFTNINNSPLTESPLTHSLFHSNQNEDTDLSTLKIPISPTFESKEEKRHRKHLQKVI
jgi:hypothetical protein